MASSRSKDILVSGRSSCCQGPFPARKEKKRKRKIPPAEGRAHPNQDPRHGIECMCTRATTSERPWGGGGGGEGGLSTSSDRCGITKSQRRARCKSKANACRTEAGGHWLTQGLCAASYFNCCLSFLLDTGPAASCFLFRPRFEHQQKHRAACNES